MGTVLGIARTAIEWQSSLILKRTNIETVVGCNDKKFRHSLSEIPVRLCLNYKCKTSASQKNDWQKGEVHVKNCRYVLGTAFLTILLIVLLSSCSATDKFEDCVVAGNYVDAISIYQEKISGNTDKEQNAQDFMWSYINSTLSDYAEGKTDTKKAERAFGCISKINSELSVLGADFNYLYDEFHTVQLSKDSYDKAVSLVEQGDYKGAMTLFAKVNEVDTEHYDAANKQLQTVRDTYKADVLEKQQSAIEAGEYNSVIDLGLEAIAFLGENNTEIQKKVDLAYYKKTDSLIDTYLADKRYAFAIKTYEQFAEDHSSLVTPEMGEKIAAGKETWCNDIAEASINAFISDGAESALKRIQEGLAIIPDNKKLCKLYDMVRSSVPVGYREVELNQGEFCHIHFESATDSYGNSHTGSLIGFTGYTASETDRYTAKLELYPYEKFDIFSGKLFVGDMIAAPIEKTIRMKIYCDDILSYDTGILNQKWTGDDFSIDVSNVYCIRIIVTGTGYSAVSRGPHIWIEDASFSKRVTEEDLRFAIQ